MGNTIHYFINTNSSKGFVSFFKSNFEPLERVIKLDNYPTAIVEELIGKASSIATEKGYQQEIIHSCIDNSIEGIILPQLKTGLLNIPAYIDYGYSVYKLMDNETVQDMQEALTKSHEYFAKALKIHDDWEKIYITNMNFAKMNQLTSDTILKILGGHTQNKKGSSVNRLFGASTIHGPIDYIENIGFEQIQKRENALTALAMEKIREIPFVHIMGQENPEQHHGTITFTVDGVHPHDIAAILDADHIAVRAGHHCAQPLLRHLGVMASTRASLMFYNTEEEIVKFTESLKEIRRKMGYAE